MINTLSSDMSLAQILFNKLFHLYVYISIKLYWDRVNGIDVHVGIVKIEFCRE